MSIQLQPGMALGVLRSGYNHYGIYAGEVHDTPSVIHYNKRNGVKGRVELTPFREFQKGARCWVDNFGTKYTDAVLEQSFAQAASRLGEQEYDLLINNCEHFASKCVTGKSRSRQVAGFVVGAGVAALGAALLARAVAQRK